MEKIAYNLLTKNTSAPITLGSSNSVEVFTGPVVPNMNASDGRLYIHVDGFSTSLGGASGNNRTAATFNLYESWMGGPTGDWFFHTSVSLSTVTQTSLTLSGLGSYLRLGYTTQSSVRGVRLVVETDNFYDIDSLGHY